MSGNAPKVAVIHDWLVGMRGGEAVLEAILEMYPEAEVFTLFYDENRISEKIRKHKVHSSPLQSVPGALERYRHFLPLMPKAIESFDLRGYDLILSSSHCVAKGIRKPKGSVHVSYVHAPMRYMWDRFDDYFGPGRASLPVRVAARLVRGPMQRWDRRSSSKENVDLILANSGFIAERIQEAWARDSKVVYPFSDFRRFSRPRDPKGYYLVFGAFAPYKRVDLAIEAFRRLDLPLVVAGGGQEADRIRESLRGTKVEFVPSPTHEQVERFYSECRAFVFPGVEDFGITPLEAMAAGAPVLAYGAGGALETVTDKTGVFFDRQDPESLMREVLRFERGEHRFEASECRKRASEFSKARFQDEFGAAVRSVL
jgi:glycosyltransferase involved in cell wall biosynthesis